MRRPDVEDALAALVVFHLDEMRVALALSAVERVFRAVYVTHLPQAPDIVLGVVNIRGRIVPVFDTRRRFGLPPRMVALGDQLILARTARQAVALVADAVTGVLQYSARDIVTATDILPGTGQVDGVAQLGDELVLIHDLERFLSVGEKQRLSHALAARATKNESS
jgi:purine-binding chemotaxis protein CheW